MIKDSKILIIDDNEFDRKLLCQLIKKNGYPNLTLASGKNVLEIIQLEKPALVLLDINMPDISGNFVLQQIREKYSRLELPIIMTTGNTSSKDVVESLSLGANDYIFKPVPKEITLKRIEIQLRLTSLSLQMAKFREIETLNAAIATYNHEINNSLSVALGALYAVTRKKGSCPELTRAEESIWHVADMIKRISELLFREDVQYEPYANSASKMFKLK